MANKWDERKKALEDEYFVKKEKELIQKLKSKQTSEAEKAVKATCHMRCPKCGKPLKERHFQKITLDQCTGCHRVGLDSGELDQVARKEKGSWLGKLWQRGS